MTNYQGETVQLGTRIPKDLYRRLRVYCVETDTPQATVVIEALTDWLKEGRHAAGTR